MLTPGKQNFRVVGHLKNKSDIKFTKAGYMYIKLSTVSDIPQSIDVADFSDSINVAISNFGNFLYDNQTETETVRIEYIWNELSNLLIEVTPDVKLDSDRPNKYWWWGGNVQFQKLSDEFNPDSKLVALPVFSKDNSATGIETAIEFEKALRSNELLGKLKVDWPSDKYDVPEGVIWETEDFELTMYTGIEQQTHTKQGTTYLLDDKRARKIQISEFDEHWFSLQYKFKDVIYIQNDVVFGEYMTDSVKFNEDVEKAKDNTVTLSEEEGLKKVESKKSPMSETNEAITDKQVLQRLKENTRQKELYYADSDLINFHVSMKTDGMVILSGLSGTGKSKLVSEYASALQLSSGDSSSQSQVRFVSVRPFWADDSDLLGYADTVNNVYRPGDSGLIDTLIDSQDHPEDMFIIVFDEMNLARVEHYFSQFLSVLEMDAGSRALTLYNQQLETRLYNSGKYPSKITIGENVLFVGTVNTDESTYQFSDKVLDRSNVITLKMLPFGSVENAVTTPIERPKRSVVKSSEFQKLKKVSPDFKLTTSEKTMLWEIHEAINEVDANIGLGWRIVKHIDKYLMNLPQDMDGFNRSNAVDLQIVQRVLTKVRGSEEQMRSLIGNVNSDGTHEPGKLAEIFDKYAESGSFEESRKVIARKAKELKLYGFTV